MPQQKASDEQTSRVNSQPKIIVSSPFSHSQGCRYSDDVIVYAF